MRENYTVVVMPPDGSTRSYIIGAWGWRFIVGCFVLLVLGVVSGFTWAVWLREQKQSVAVQLMTLEKNHAQTAVELEKARQYLDKVKALDADIRNVLFDESESPGLGQGGFGTDIPESPDVATTSTLSPSLLQDDEIADLNTLNYASLMLDRLQELHEGIEQKRSLYNGFPSILPLQTDPEKKNYWFSSGFGNRIHPLTGRKQFHKGLDISAKRGTCIIAPADGRVLSAETDQYLGRVIRLEHHSFQGKHVTVYGHMNEFAEGLKKGDPVKRRQVIGYVGRSGRTTGSHLHYEVSTDGIAKNPMHYIIRESKDI